VNIERLPEIFQVDEVRIPPRFNIAPTQEAPIVIRTEEGSDRLELFRWGLVPTWADENTGFRMINARSETVHRKPAYRDAFRRRRCLVPADGFYEWKKTGNRKQPYYFYLRDRTTFAFAGIWECKPVESGTLNTYSILTCEANPLVAEVHPRMPVILPRTEWEVWLNRSTGEERALTVLKPYDPDEMQSHPVGLAVNRPANDSPECIRPKTEPGLLF